jgi:hypothetical protein
MLGLPPVPPVTGFATRIRLPRDYNVRTGSNDYSVHPQAIGTLAMKASEKSSFVNRKETKSF